MCLKKITFVDKKWMKRRVSSMSSRQLDVCVVRQGQKPLYVQTFPQCRWTQLFHGFCLVWI